MVTDKDRLREREERIARLYVIIARLATTSPLTESQQGEVEDITRSVHFDDLIKSLEPIYPAIHS